jgi:hypothetical protein
MTKVHFSTTEVSFDLSLTKKHKSPVYEDEVKKLWYSSNELKKIRNQTYKLAGLENDLPYAKVIQGTYHTLCSINWETEDDSLLLNDVQHEVLSRWIKSYPDLFGMDKFVKCDVPKLHRKHCEDIFETQIMDWDDCVQSVFEQSQESSRASRMYARTIAQVQMEVELEDEPPAQGLLDNAARGLHLPKRGKGLHLRRPLFSSLARNTRGGTAA